MFLLPDLPFILAVIRMREIAGGVQGMFQEQSSELGSMRWISVSTDNSGPSTQIAFPQKD